MTLGGLSTEHENSYREASFPTLLRAQFYPFSSDLDVGQVSSSTYILVPRLTRNDSYSSLLFSAYATGVFTGVITSGSQDHEETQPHPTPPAEKQRIK